MKRSHIIALIIIAVGTGIIISTLTTTSEYANFAEAKRNTDKEFTVIGVLDTSAPVVYNPKVDADKTTFNMIDKAGLSVQVDLLQAKPTDFEKSEDIVVKGKMEGEAFVAHTILLKCPSKYNEQNGITQL